MSLKISLIKQILTWIIGNDVARKIQRIVDKLMRTSNQTGAEKRAEAIRQIGDLGISLSGSLINLAIEVFVTYLKEQSKK